MAIFLYKFLVSSVFRKRFDYSETPTRRAITELEELASFSKSTD